VTRRDRTVVIAVLALALIAGYWFLLLAPKRKEAADLQQQVSQTTQRYQTAQSSIASGLAARREYASNYGAVARLGEAVPTDDNVPSLVYQLDSAAHAANVDFRSVKLVQASGVAAAAPAAPAAPAAAASASTSASATSSAPAAQSAAAGLPPGASVGAAGFPTMPFALTFDGSFFHMGDFFHRLDAFVKASNQRPVAVGGRLLSVDGFSLTAGRRGFPSVKASVASTAYLVPANQGLTGGASPSSPAAAGAAPQSASTAGTPPAPAPATATAPVR